MKIPLASLAGRLMSRAKTSDDAREPAAETQPQNQFRRAIDNMRATTRWLVVSLAALGAVLAGQGLFTNIGKLGIHDWRLWVALGAAAVGLVAVAVVIWLAADVFKPVEVKLPELVGREELRQFFDANPILLHGLSRSLAGFHDRYTSATNDLIDAKESLRTNPEDVNARRDLKRAETDLYEMSPIVERIKDQAMHADVRRKFERAQVGMILAALAAGLTLLVVAWAANPPQRKAANAVAAPAEPAVVSVALTPQGRSRLAGLLACKQATLRAVVVGGSATTPEVVTVPERGCRTIRFVVTDALGTAVRTG